MIAPMPRWEQALWYAYCAAGLALVAWCDYGDEPAADLWLRISLFAAVGVGIAYWVTLCHAPLRWWIAAAAVWIFLPCRWDELTGYPPLPDVPDTTYLWMTSGVFGGTLYAQWKGFSFRVRNEETLMEALHCAYWGAVVGPPLLAFSVVALLWTWCRARQAVAPVPAVARPWPSYRPDTPRSRPRPNSTPPLPLQPHQPSRVRFRSRNSRRPTYRAVTEREAAQAGGGKSTRMARRVDYLRVRITATTKTLARRINNAVRNAVTAAMTAGSAAFSDGGSSPGGASGAQYGFSKGSLTVGSEVSTCDPTKAAARRQTLAGRLPYNRDADSWRARVIIMESGSSLTPA